MLRGLTDFAQEWKAMEGVARSLGVELHLIEVREPTAFASAFAAMTPYTSTRSSCLGTPLFVPYRRQIVDPRGPAASALDLRGRGYAEMGCLMSYGSSQLDRGQRIAAYVDKILQGAKPADLPVEQPMKFELVINLKTAKALGLTIPPLLLFQADEVIQ